MAPKSAILIVDDDVNLTSNLRDILEAEGYATAVGHDGQMALSLCREKVFDLALVDMKLPDISGVALIEKLDELSGETVYIIITGYGSMDSAIEAVKQRSIVAYETKPLNIDHLLALISQVAERKQVEDLLKESERKYETIFETTGTATAIVEEDLTLSLVNTEFEKLSGYSKEEIEGKKSETEFVIEDDLVRAKEYHHLRRVDPSAVPEGYEFRFIDREGRIKDIHITANVIPETKKCVVSLLDITERKKMQAQLIQAEKLSAVGTMAAGIAHELLNPMMGMLNFALYCLEHTVEDDPRHAALQDIERETRRCADIVNNLLTFSHTGKQGEKEYQQESLATIIDRVVRLLSYRIETHNISLSQHIDEGTREVWMEASSLQQVFLNLISNALDAVEEAEKKEIRVDVHRDGEFIEAIITDSGRGISAENLGKIFDPFFTTKPVAQGTGLGLALSRNIILEHEGSITCESKPGVGTTFRILLPVEIKGGAK